MNGYQEQKLENERYLCEQDAIWAQALIDILSEEGIAFRTQQVYGAGLAAYVGPIMERTQFYVEEACLSHAREVVRVLFSQTVLEEEAPEAEPMPGEVSEHIRRARVQDAGRIAEMEVFNYRLNFYPIFHNDEFYFSELSVLEKKAEYERQTEHFWVYDDGVVKGFIRVENGEIQKLFIEPVLQGRGIGAALLKYAVNKLDAQYLWALEKNVRAIAFYHRHGFYLTGKRKREEDTEEYLVHLRRLTP